LAVKLGKRQWRVHEKRPEPGFAFAQLLLRLLQTGNFFIKAAFEND
jgi:hypothetical protein